MQNPQVAEPGRKKFKKELENVLGAIFSLSDSKSLSIKILNALFIPSLNIKGKLTWYQSSGELKLRDLQQL